jgi:hypothetical protein
VAGDVQLKLVTFSGAGDVQHFASLPVFAGDVELELVTFR